MLTEGGEGESPFPDDPPAPHSRKEAMSETLNIDLTELTLGDMEEVESIIEAPWSEVFTTDGRVSGTRAFIALAYVFKRKTEPDFTLEDARAIKLDDLNLGSEAPDPTDAAGSNA